MSHSSPHSDRNQSAIIKTDLSLFQRLPICFIDDFVVYEKSVDVLRQLNRNILILCDFSIKEVNEDVNLILIEVEYVRKEFFLHLFKTLKPSAAFILQLEKEDSTCWISAILESQILSIDVDTENISNSQQFSYNRINNTLWKELYSYYSF